MVYIPFFLIAAGQTGLSRHFAWRRPSATCWLPDILSLFHAEVIFTYPIADDLGIRRHHFGDALGDEHVRILWKNAFHSSPAPTRRSDGIHYIGWPAMTADLGPLLVRSRRFRRALNVDDHAAMDRLIAAVEAREPVLARHHDDPLEAAVVAVLLELVQEADARAARA